MTSKRTCMCGVLTLADVGQAVTLMGWVRTHRDHGQLIFVDLWDRTGTTQIVIDAQASPSVHAQAGTLRDEYVVAVTGEVRARPAETRSEAKTGAVEVLATRLHVLNAAKHPPFSLNADEDDVEESVRLRYRYLDLRRAARQRMLRLRHKLVKALRDGLDARDFLEVETPMLTRSTPEGARDYLVPSRLHPGTFYALPQSPQQMKQLLMVAGVDRYFQLARCFRDEDLRADRQPEFTQLDLEMSFVARDDVLALVESLLPKVLRTLMPEKHVVTPFPRLTHAESLARYGSDKPDLRYEMELVDVTELWREAPGPLRQMLALGGRVKALRVPDAAGLDPRTLPGPTGDTRWGWLSLNGRERGAGLPQSISTAHRDALLKMTGAQQGDLVILTAGAGERVNSALDTLRRDVAERLDRADPDTLAFAWIVDFPLFARDAETGRWLSEHHPFTAPKPEDAHLLEQAPGRVRADAYDLVCNGWELGSGSLRIHQRALQERIFEILGYAPAAIRQSFGPLLEAFEYGAPPHGGIALGVDRLMALLTGADSLRGVIAFPKNRQAVDVMMDAPTPVTVEQLETLSLRTTAPLEAAPEQRAPETEAPASTAGDIATHRIDTEQVRHIAQLIRMAVTEEEMAAFSEQMSTIIDYFDLLGEADVSDVAPASQPPISRAHLRADEPTPSLPREDFLANAPRQRDAYVQVAMVLDEKS